MSAKIDLFAAAPALMKNWQRSSIELSAAASLEHSLTELVKLRASQINGCANCVNLHATEARENGETEQRIYLLPAWREAPCYSDRERAALNWTEALTRCWPCKRLRRAEGAFHGGGADQAHLDDQHHQRLEPHLRRFWPVCRPGCHQGC